LQSSTSPDAVKAQGILLRRLALQGDVVGSRVPAPRNISEIGGYINLLGTLKEGAIREQALAGVFGVAGPASELSFEDAGPPLAFVGLANDRPPGPAQATLPLSVPVRSDFLPALGAAIAVLHANGATLPLTSPPAIVLPPGGPGVIPPTDILFYLGRTLNLAPAAALATPAIDPLTLVRAAGGSGPFAVAANAINPATNPVLAANYDALSCNATSCSTVSLVNAALVPLAPVMANAGFYQPTPPPQPGNNKDVTWTRFTNVTGLVIGQTKLGDELAALYGAATIAHSAFAAMVAATWTGVTFA
jgi:hypothetical protein